MENIPLIESFVLYLILFDLCIMLYRYLNSKSSTSLYYSALTAVIIHHLIINIIQYSNTSEFLLHPVLNVIIHIIIVLLIGLGIILVGSAWYERVFNHKHIGGVSHITTTNIYSIMRHPQYSGTILCIIGFTLLYQSITLGLITIIAIHFYIICSLKEEEQLRKKFNEEYVQYMTSTNQFIPKIKEKFKMKKSIIITLSIIIIEAVLLTILPETYIVPWTLFIGTILITAGSITFLIILGLIQGISSLFHKPVFTTTLFIKTGYVLLFTAIIASLQIGVSEWIKHTPNTAVHASIEEVIINDRSEYITVRSDDLTNPVILFLAGGPGGSQVQPTRMFLDELEEDYTIINWEQPGSGMSYNAYDTDELSLERYILDAHELTTYLKETYNQDKIYIIGESWGSYLAVELAIQYPEDYHAIMTTGQMVDFLETEIYCYNKAIEIARDNNDQDRVDTLLNQKEPPYEDGNISLKMANYLTYLHQQMAHSTEINHVNYDTFDQLFSHEYSIIDSVNFMKALYFTFDHVYRQLLDTDLRETHTSIPIPVYILHGEHDINAPLYLVEDYYDQINAPSKELIIFDESGHNPWITEADRFVDEVQRITSIYSN